jgi:hypothetical protein
VACFEQQSAFMDSKTEEYSHYYGLFPGWDLGLERSRTGQTKELNGAEPMPIRACVFGKIFSLIFS